MSSAPMIISKGRVGPVTAASVGSWGRLGQISKIITEAIVRVLTPTKAVPVGEYITESILYPRRTVSIIREMIVEVLAKFPGQ